MSSLLPPGSCLQFVSSIGFSNLTARRFFIECRPGPWYVPLLPISLLLFLFIADVRPASAVAVRRITNIFRPRLHAGALIRGVGEF